MLFAVNASEMVTEITGRACKLPQRKDVGSTGKDTSAVTLLRHLAPRSWKLRDDGRGAYLQVLQQLCPTRGVSQSAPDRWR